MSGPLSAPALPDLHMVLYQPEIPPNTGNIARLCAATGVALHLIEPLGFSIDDKQLKRAGLDYWPHVRVFVWPDFEAYITGPGQKRRLIGASARQGEMYHRFRFLPTDAIILGPETRGLPPDIIEKTDGVARIPIRDTVRSLNLSTAAGILLYQALAGTGFLDTLPA